MEVSVIHNEGAIVAICDYMDECLFEPAPNWPRHHFEQRVYARWAAKEILDRILAKPQELAVDVVDGFAFEMAQYAYMADGTKQGVIFSTAAETAEDLLLLLV